MNNYIPHYRIIGFDNYSDYLDSKHWAHLRRMYWESGQSHYCRICESTKKLVIHHRTYETLGYEDIYKDVVMLCQNCHEKIHFFGNQKTPLRRRELIAREEYLYKKYRTFWARLGRFRLGSLINSIFT